ncbi:hypothetical protein BDQ17DRAFT_1357184 [Cyathus striatus]|nr:hypothetical protein BDQ17DRAFT_1357184 [Cyathus striatus]
MSQWILNTDHTSTYLKFPLLYATLGRLGYEIPLRLFYFYSIYILRKLWKRDIRTSNSVPVLVFVASVWIVVGFGFGADVFTFWQYVSDVEAGTSSGVDLDRLSGDELWKTFLSMSWMSDSIVEVGSIMILLSHIKSPYGPKMRVFLGLFAVASICLELSRLLISSPSKAILIFHLYTTAALKIVVTSLISWERYLFIKDGKLNISSGYASPVAALIATFIECSILCVSLDLFFVIPFLATGEVWRVLLRLIAYFQCIAMFFVILRVVHGVTLVLLLGRAFEDLGGDVKLRDSSDGVLLKDSV